jgi:hypothetical protein
LQGSHAEKKSEGRMSESNLTAEEQLDCKHGLALVQCIRCLREGNESLRRRIAELEQQLADAAKNYFALSTAAEPRAVHEREPPHCPTCECGEAKQDILHDVAGTDFCEDCPPVNYPTDKTRCADCPRRAAATKGAVK